MIRIDPLTEDGKFDTEFFSSDDYNKYRARVEWYIIQEGFNLEYQTHIIQLLDHFWQVQITPFSN